MLDDGRAGMLVDRIDVEGWREALRTALADRDDWPALGRAGRERAAEHYTVSAMADAYQAAIDAVLAGPEPHDAEPHDAEPHDAERGR
jgi:glycosyltransferase involved in cell wall biosynthesis